MPYNCSDILNIIVSKLYREGTAPALSIESKLQNEHGEFSSGKAEHEFNLIVPSINLPDGTQVKGCFKYLSRNFNFYAEY
ncbi:MAG: hypothetical protein WCA84_03585 [Ignavibacteriaceae bacterium]